jgi:prolyl-tRNA editing enzyme YbaK/EbsC (Cys-tRNA(Pro) deacylase)
MEMEFPFWDMICDMNIPVVDTRALHYLTRGVHQAAHRLNARLQQMVEVSVYWSGIRPFVVLHSALNQVDLEKLQTWFGLTVRPANSIEMSILCGTHIHGAPPVGQSYQMPILIDGDLMSESVVWVSGGDPAFWVALTPMNLVRVTGGYVVHVKRPTYRPLAQHQASS